MESYNKKRRREEIKRKFFLNISELLDHWNDEKWINKKFEEMNVKQK